MAVWDAGTLSSVSGVLFTAVPESRVQSIGRITLEVKCAGARSARNPHAPCDAAGAVDGATESPNRARRGKPRTQPRILLAGLCALLIRPARLIRSAIVLKPSTLLSLHQALKNRKYRILSSSKRRGKPEPKGPNQELMEAIVQMKLLNPTWRGSLI